MSAIEWNEAKLKSLGRIFLRKVLDNMRLDGSTVRFGETGQGIAPNYQITFSNGLVRVRDGKSHGDFKRVNEFNLNNLSKIFTYADIKKAYDPREN